MVESKEANSILQRFLKLLETSIAARDALGGSEEICTFGSRPDNVNDLSIIFSSKKIDKDSAYRNQCILFIKELYQLFGSIGDINFCIGQHNFFERGEYGKPVYDLNEYCTMNDPRIYPNSLRCWTDSSNQQIIGVLKNLHSRTEQFMMDDVTARLTIFLAQLQIRFPRCKIPNTPSTKKALRLALQYPDNFELSIDLGKVVTVDEQENIFAQYTAIFARDKAHYPFSPSQTISLRIPLASPDTVTPESIYRKYIVGKVWIKSKEEAAKMLENREKLYKILDANILTMLPHELVRLIFEFFELKDFSANESKQPKMR